MANERSGLRPSGCSAKPEPVVSALRASIPNAARWTYGGTFPHFAVFREPARRLGDTQSDADMNGTYDSELDATECLVAGLEASRRAISGEIAMHKARLRKLRQG
jgi:hypothetical protein